MSLIQSQKLQHVHESSLPGGVQAVEEDSAEGSDSAADSWLLCEGQEAKGALE